MGKKRTITIGSEEEQMQKDEAAKRREAKKVAKAAEKESDATNVTESETTDSSSVILNDSEGSHSTDTTSEERDSSPMAQNDTEEKPKKKMEKKEAVSTYQPSPRHNANVQKAKDTQYSVSTALDTLLGFQSAKFDETVELHVNTTDKVTGSVVLPHGTGKEVRVAILAPLQDAQAAQKLLDKIDAGQIDFDLLIATPDAMPRLAKAAKILGPRGLMPNPKNGTVAANPEEAAKKFAGGQINYKTEGKVNIVHMALGKLSFGKEKLADNIKAFLGSLEKGKVKSVYLKSTMSPSLRIG